MKCKRKDDFNPEVSRICSDHFTEEDYQRDLRNELLQLSSRKILKKNAIPSKNLPLEKAEMNSASAVSLRLVNRNVRKRALKRMKDLSPTKKQKKQIIEDCSFEYSGQIMSERIKELEEENFKLKNHISKLEKKVKLMSINSDRQKKLLICKINFLKRNLEKSFQKKTSERVKSVLGKILSPSQIKMLIDGKRISKWNEQDITNAISLRAVSTKCYAFLRNRMGMPLPSISTLKRWCRNIDFSEGILTSILNFMKTKGDSMTAADKFTMICFDEMNLDSRICYDAAKDKILGPHSNVQVVMAKGIVKHWKQPIYYDFDQPITKELLFEIIKIMEENEFNVLGIVSDLGGKNIRLWNELNVTPESNSFLNPSDKSRKILVFADFPHLLKLLRNHLLDHGIKLASGKIIEKSIFENLLEVDSGELKICPKLTWAHISVKRNERQNVRMAAQLLSDHVAKALAYYFPDEKETSDFLKVIDGCFDVFNSRTPVNDKDLRCGFGIKLETQNDILLQAKKYVQEMRIVGRANLLPFQKGWIISISSLIELLHFLQQYGLKYVITSRLNQDALESLFSQIRGLGHFYDHPLPIDFKYRLRQVLLCNKLPLPSASVATKEIDQENFLSAQLFNSLINDNDLKEVEKPAETSVLEDNDEQIFNDIDLTLANDAAEVLNISEDCSKEALRFIAGYIAFKVRDKNLGTNTASIEDVNIPHTWIEMLSRGGLVTPSQKWFETVQHLERCFTLFHGENKLKNCEGVIKNFSEILIKKFPEENATALKLFAKTRTFFRIKYLNSAAARRKNEKINKRWGKSQK